MKFEEVFEFIIREFSLRIYDILKRKVRNDHTAKDLSQEVFLKLFRYKREQLTAAFKKTPRGAIVTQELKLLVYGAVKDVYVDHCRREATKLPEEALDAETAMASVRARQFDVIQLKELKTKMVEVFAHLSHRCKKILSLYYMNELRYQEVAQAMNWDLGTVKSNLHRCKVKLRLIIETNYPELILD